jgi:hypothetical protein
VQQPETKFLNVDLDIYNDEPLDELIAAIEKFAIVIARQDTFVTLELPQTKSLDETLRHLANSLSALSPAQKALWNSCKRRVFNIGLEAGHNRQSVFPIAKETIALLADIQGEVEITIYASPEPEKIKAF